MFSPLSAFVRSLLPLLVLFARDVLLPLVNRKTEAFLAHRNTRPALLIGAMSVALVGTASAANAPGELQRRYNNGTKIRQIHTASQPKFQAVINDLEKNGQRPYIAQAWRSEAEQLRLYNQRPRVTWVTYSYHNATTKSGGPDALAFDLVPYQNNPNAYWEDGHDDFYLMAASSAKSHKLGSGIYWGLPTSQRQRIDQAITAKVWKRKPPDATKFYSGVKFGIDQYHVEHSTLSLAKVKAGKRP